MAIGIPSPYANGVSRGHTHRPGIAEAITGAGFPGCLPHRTDQPPVQFIRPVYLFQSLQRIPYGEAGCLTETGIGACDFVQAAFAAAQNKGQAVVPGIGR